MEPWEGWDHSLAWSGANLFALNRAVWHGCREDSRREDWDPPSGWDDQPPREWCARFYAANRERFRAKFARTPGSSLAAWPVAHFDPDARLRADAAAAVGVAEERRIGLEAVDDR